MKEISFKNNRSIRTPWLRIDEAAAYCSLSRSAFLAHANNLPHGGSNRTRIYHVDILDDWIANRFEEDTPGNYQGVSNIKTKDMPVGESMELVNPKNGKIFKVRE